jgi:hypothetical protein
MFQARWIAFQIVVAMLTFWWIGTWADIRQFGIAPAVVSMFGRVHGDRATDSVH